MANQNPQRCPYCLSTSLTRKGHRKKKLETVQLFRCGACMRVFTPNHVKGKTFPLPMILEALNLFNQGFSAAAVVIRLKERHGIAASDSTIEAWAREYVGLCRYARLRDHIRTLDSPHQLIRTVKLYHRQIYEFSLHRGKLDVLLGPNGPNPSLAALRIFLESMLRDCPHALFRETDRASSNRTEFNMNQVQIVRKENFATRIARFVLPTVSENKRRHAALQRFMLLNDSVTVAVEVPIYFLPGDRKHMQQRLGFKIPVAFDHAITGHIDFLQVRNDAVHILDYKPDAEINKPIQQLTIYALALSRLTGLRLYDFKCAWFNENS